MYLVCMVNIGVFVGQYFWFEGYDMIIFEVDGVYIKVKVIDMIYFFVGQWMSFFLKIKDSVDSNFVFVGSMDMVR